MLFGCSLTRNGCRNGCNTFHGTGHILYPLKRPENQNFADVFKGIERDQWRDMG